MILLFKRYDGKNVQDWIMISEKSQKPVLAVEFANGTRSAAEVGSFSSIKTFEVRAVHLFMYGA